MTFDWLYYRLNIMFDNPLATLSESYITYPITDSELPFAEYIALSRQLIEERRPDLASPHAELIVEANSPFELYPHQAPSINRKYKYGALLLHGLLDSPFSLRDIGNYLQVNGILSRAILLPGHGTHPNDLLPISYHDWIQSVRYGMDIMRKDVEKIFLVGYSTGALLALYQALQANHVAGLILLAPAIKIKAPVDIVVNWHYFIRWLKQNKAWVYKEKECDYTKYQSIAFNPVHQVAALGRVIKELSTYRTLTTPTFMVLTDADETISSRHAIDFFVHSNLENNQLLLYSASANTFSDTRILLRQAAYPDLHITNLSHICLPYAPTNPHYGKNGDYLHATRCDPAFRYGAYNRLEVNLYSQLYELGIIKQQHQILTFNPDFTFMAEKIIQFILRN